MTCRLEPLGNIGAVVSGITLHQLNTEQVSFIKQAMLDHLVLFFRDQRLDPAALRSLAACFGEPVPYPYVEGLPNLPEVIEVTKQPDETINFGGVWHSDTAYLDAPSAGALLYAVDVPDKGGDTIFTNMYQVLEDLSPGLQAFLAPLSAINDADKAAIAATRPAAQRKGLRATHPVIRTHPETGRKLLYVDRAHTTHFDGMTEAESAPLLAYLFDRIEQPAYACRFQWQPGSLAFWDNRACQHFPVNDYDGSLRRMLRVSLAGDKPV